MLTAIVLMYIIIRYIITYLKTDNFSNHEYANRKTTKNQIKLLILAVILDAVIVRTFFRKVLLGL